MRLSELLHGVAVKKVIGKKEVEISSICHDHREAKRRSLFFAIKGKNFDGNMFVEEAKNGGAEVVVCEEQIDVVGITQVVVENVRDSMSIIAANFEKRPAEKLKIISITGTNGKTTTAHIVSHILKSEGKKVALMGTNGCFIVDEKIDTKMTTPDPILLQKLFAKMVDCGIEYVVMETSAHALKLGKTKGVMSDIAVFTNLSQDHLDDFGTMGNYGEAKRKLFSSEFCKTAIINCDDLFGKNISESCDVKTVTCSKSKGSEFQILKIKNQKAGQIFVLRYNNINYGFQSGLIGEFNVFNSMLAIACCVKLGIDMTHIQKSFQSLPQVQGRMNFYKTSNNRLVVIDYAHSPDGISNALRTLRKIRKRGKLWVVFGAGGDRDKSKRPLMGETAEKYADKVILTSDNPRTETPLSIMSDVAKGFLLKKHILIEDRKQAILYSIEKSKRNDIIAILGKGCENYIDVNNTKFPYSDYEVVEKAINLVN